MEPKRNPKPVAPRKQAKKNMNRTQSVAKLKSPFPYRTAPQKKKK